MCLRCIGGDDGCATVACEAMAFGIDDEGYASMVAEVDDCMDEIVGENTFSVVREDTGMQTIELLLDTIENIGLGLCWNIVSLFAVGTHHLLTMGENACLGSGGSIFTWVEMHGDAWCLRA